MSDKDQPISIEDLKGAKLKETTTKAQEVEMKLVFKCEECDEIVDWPVCCGEPMELEDDQLVCADKTCGNTMPIPQCDAGHTCKPFLTKA